MPVQHLKQHMERTFRQLAADKGLDFNVKFDGKLPQTIRTDEKRLQQIVLNLLSNAFKFTSKGSVTLGVRCADERLEPEPSGAAQCRPRDRDCGHRHRHRHSRGQAEAHLRGVPAGRRHDQPQIWRHGPRPFDQPRDRAPARRRAPGPLEAGRRIDLHALRAARSGIDLGRASSGTPARYDNSGAVVPTALPTGLRGQRRPRRARQGSVRADRRGRSDLRVDPARCRARGRAQGRRLDRGRGHAWRWRASFSRPRSRSISAWPTSTASCCSTC